MRMVIRIERMWSYMRRQGMHRAPVIQWVVVVKQTGALHRSVVVRHLTHGIYHLDYSLMYIDFFIRN